MMSGKIHFQRVNLEDTLEGGEDGGAGSNVGESEGLFSGGIEGLESISLDLL